MKQGTVRQRHTVRCPRLPDGQVAPHKCHGLWQYRLDLGNDRDGLRRRYSKGGFATRKAAALAMKKTLEELSAGVDLETSLTVAEYLDQWLVSKRALRPGTVKSYREHIAFHITPQVGHVALRDLRPRQVDIMITALARVHGGKALTPSTIRRIHATLRVALNDAVKRRLISYNPAAHVELPVARKPRTAVWDAKEVAAFLEATGDDELALAYRLVVMTGMRRGELCGLRWADVDTATGYVRVSQAITDVDGQIRVGEPKTKAGLRVVPLDVATCQLLESHRGERLQAATAWGGSYQDNDYVFGRPDGSVLRPDTLARRFRRAARAAGLPAIRFHDLRHTSASLALAAGVPIRVVSDRLGHSSTAITADLYTHVVGTVARGAAEAIAEVVAEAGRQANVSIGAKMGPQQKLDGENPIEGGVR